MKRSEDLSEKEPPARRGAPLISRRILGRLLLPLFIVGLLATSVFGYSLIVAQRQPSEIERFVPEYTYKHDALLDYRVHLKQNVLFGETTLGSGQNYFTKVIDGIDVVFSYNFRGDPANEVKGTYEIRAILVSGDLSAELEGKAGKVTKLWEKASVIIPATPFTGQNGTVSIKETLPLVLQEFESQAKTVSEELGIAPRQHYVKLLGIVKTSASLPSRELSAKELEASLVVPLNQSYFTMTSKPASAEDSVGKTEVVVLSDVIERREEALRSTLIAGGIAGVFGILVLLRLALRPVGRKTQPAYIVPRRYRDRVAEANGQANYLAGDVVSLLSFEDLIKVADEAGKPIVHQTFANDSDIRDAFYVNDGSVRYAYLVKENDDRQRLPNEAGEQSD
jgi:hypothetical protein